MKKLLAAVLGLALLVALVVVLLPRNRGAAAVGRGLPEVAQPAATPGDLSLEDREAPAGAALAERVEVLPQAPPTVVPWRGELAGVTGRVIEDDGTPVAGIRVALLEFDVTDIFTSELLDEPRQPTLELEETVTDADGRFLLGGAQAATFTGLGVDLGGPRSTVRLIDQALVHRERTDLGDIVLAPFGVLTGRVIDETGAPVQGARVRAGAFPEEVTQVPVYDLRPESLVAITLLAANGEGQGIIELPDWVRRLVDRLPVPTTYTDADGAFRLEGVPLAPIVGGVDKPGHAGIPLGPLDLSAGDADAGDLVLTRGRTVRGVVEDSYGDPIAGAEVFLGAELPIGPVAFLQSCAPTDAEGRFELGGVAEQGQVVVVARRTRHEPWTSVVVPGGAEVLLELEATLELTVVAQDAGGEPVSNAVVRVTPAASADQSLMGFGEVLAILPANHSPPDAFREVERGRYRLGGLTPGAYEITVRAAGLAPTIVREELWEEESEVVVGLTSGRRLDVSVVDTTTGEAVDDARVSVLRASTSGFTKLAVDLTDAAGRAELGPIGYPAPAEAGGERAFLEDTWMLLVQHPRYSQHSELLDPGATSAVVELESGGVLAGRVHWGGEIPTKLYMLILEYRGADGFLEMFHMPRFALTDLAGEFRVANLAPGSYRVELVERFLDQDLTALMRPDFSPATLHREVVEIANGQTTDLVIDLTPTGRGVTAHLRGSVRVNGRDVVGAEVEVRGNGAVQVHTDEWGRFDAPDVSVRDNVRVTITGDVELVPGEMRRVRIYRESLELKPNELRKIELDLYPLSVPVRVVDASSGEPLAGAEVAASSKQEDHRSGFRDEDGRTDAQGEASLLVSRANEYVVKAELEGYTQGSGEVEVVEGEPTDPVVVKLRRAVPCAGRVQIDGDLAGGGFSYIHAQGDGASSGTLIRAPDYAFELDGLAPGTYQASIYMSGVQGRATFELGPDGDRDLVLPFVPEERERAR